MRHQVLIYETETSLNLSFYFNYGRRPISNMQSKNRNNSKSRSTKINHFYFLLVLQLLLLGLMYQSEVSATNILKIIL